MPYNEYKGRRMKKKMNLGIKINKTEHLRLDQPTPTIILCVLSTQYQYLFIFISRLSLILLISWYRDSPPVVSVQWCQSDSHSLFFPSHILHSPPSSSQPPPPVQQTLEGSRCLCVCVCVCVCVWWGCFLRPWECHCSLMVLWRGGFDDGQRLAQ